MRKKIIAGNWKMNKNITETGVLLDQLAGLLSGFREDIGIVIAPPLTSLAAAREKIGAAPIKLAAQNVSDRDDGAFTGEISARMLVAAGCTYVIVGHSERRQYHGETNELINTKAGKALAAGLVPIICVGEMLAEREANLTETVITAQIRGVLAGFTASDVRKVIVAYEPVWAIGTGRTATPQQANDVHRLIRSRTSELFDRETADILVIQYGGSVNAENALELLSQPDIDGALVGGASLKAESFWAIIRAAVSTAGGKQPARV